MYSYGSPHMAAQKQDDQHERTFSSYVRIRDVVLKTYLGRWTIGRSGERGSRISVLPARYDDDDDIYIYQHIGIMVSMFVNSQGDRNSIPGRIRPKTQKFYLMLPYLALGIIRYESRVSWAIHGKEKRPPLKLGVVTIEKLAFASPSSMFG